MNRVGTGCGGAKQANQAIQAAMPLISSLPRAVSLPGVPLQVRQQHGELQAYDFSHGCWVVLWDYQGLSLTCQTQ